MTDNNEEEVHNPAKDKKRKEMSYLVSLLFLCGVIYCYNFVALDSLSVKSHLRP